MENQNMQASGLPIPVSKIREGFNYRRRYDPAKMSSLQASIKSQGLIQPVVVRKLDDDDYQLIAGGRRYRAYVAEFGEQAEIPAIVRVLTDAEATAAMIAENNEREDPSVIEDAEGAARMLGLCKGDREEAARRLGWNRNKLDRRLAIMNAIDEVRNAYLEDKILVGHVEILAALRKDVQAKVITAILTAPSVPTVEQLKAMAEQALLSLEAAIFARDDCNGCHFNTGYQRSMFDNSFEGSRCTNKECFNQKTEEELEKRRAALAESYQVVRIVRPGDDKTVLPLRAEGPRGVGEEQALACRTCAEFGACVSAVPEKLGNVYKDVCFNKTCNDEKVAAQAKALKDLQSPPVETPPASAPANPAAAPTSNAVASKAAPTGGTKTEKAPSANTVRGPVVEYREGIWRAIFARAATKLTPIQSRALLLALTLTRSSDLDGRGASAAIAEALGISEIRSLTNPEAVLRTLVGLEQQQLASALQLLPANVSKTMPIREITAYLNVLDVRIENYWKLNENFLNILTKVEIDAVCIEVGLADAAGKHYDRLKNGPKGDFVKGVLKVEGFDYLGAIPALMRWSAA